MGRVLLFIFAPGCVSSAAMFPSKCSSQRFASITAREASMATAFLWMYRSKRHMNQTFLIASSMSYLNVSLDRGDELPDVKRAPSRAHWCKGFLQPWRTLSNFPQEKLRWEQIFSPVDVSILAPETLSKKFVSPLFNLSYALPRRDKTGRRGYRLCAPFRCCTSELAVFQCT